MITYPLGIGALTTRVFESGNSGPVVIFVHGTGGRADRWIRNMDALAAAGYHAYAFDLPGHGFASKGAGVACSVPAYREFLAQFISAIGATKPTIVGTSLGGHVVASYATAHADDITSIVLCGSMGLVAIGDEARGRIQAGANNQTREGIASKMTRVIHDPVHVTPEMLEEEFRVNNSPGASESFKTLGQYIAADLDKDVVGDALARQKFPVLLVWGAEDKTVAPSVGEAARKLLPTSHLAVLGGAAHTVYYERADDFNAVLIDFLQGRTGQHQAAGLSWS
jgi:pimeloyl-ACP methyl ester carboxylesterase